MTQKVESINKVESKKRSELLAKSPFLDQTDGIIKVGGRLARADLTFGRKHPTLIPDNLKGDALIGYIHAKTDHQGRKSLPPPLEKQDSGLLEDVAESTV